MWPGLSHVAVNDEDEVVGICLVRVSVATPEGTNMSHRVFLRKEEVKDATHAHVSSLCVLPKYQRQGVARGLLTTCRMALTDDMFRQLMEIHHSAICEDIVRCFRGHFTCEKVE